MKEGYGRYTEQKHDYYTKKGKLTNQTVAVMYIKAKTPTQT